MRTIAEIIQANMEPAEPAAAILAFLKANDGKRLTKVHRDKLREQLGTNELHLNYTAGMTHIEWGTYTERREGTGGGSLLVSYATKNVVIDAAWVEENNAAYFAARVKRNEKRQAMLDDTDLLDRIQQAIDAYNKAKADLDAVLDDNDFHQPDASDIRKELVGGDNK